MTSIARSKRYFLAALCLLAIGGNSAADDKATCPSLTGEWAGHFDGSVAGSWTGSFAQTETSLTATASAELRGIEISGSGAAEVSCDAGVITIEGSGKVEGHTGTFTGYGDKTGKTLVGNWKSGNLKGTWSGTRTTP